MILSNQSAFQKSLAAGMLLLGAAWSMPAAAKGEVSFCGVEEFSDAEFDAALKSMDDEDHTALFDLTDSVEEKCRPKVSSAMRSDEKFKGFVFDDTLTFTARRHLVRKGLNMDAFDETINMRCNLAEFPESGDLSDKGDRLIDQAISAAGLLPKGISDKERTEIILYVAAQALRWHDGRALGLLPACK